MTAPASERKAYFIRASSEHKHDELRSSFKLFGSDAYANSIGDILYATYHDISKTEAIPPKYILVSRVHPRADIYAAGSRTQAFQELRVNHITGGVESAIRAMDHILEGEKTRETPQMQVLASRADELFDLFSRDFQSITNEEFVEARAKTMALLARVKLDPDLILNQQKQRIVQWVIKGSYGKDRLDRNNRLITVMSLSAAYRRAMEKLKGIGFITGKFVRMREALIFERNFSRSLFGDVEKRLREGALPAHKYFGIPDGRTNRGEHVIAGLLGTTIFQLRQSHVNPYKQAGLEATKVVEEIVSLIQNNRRPEVIRRQLFVRAHTIVADTLSNYSFVYPDSQGE